MSKYIDISGYHIKKCKLENDEYKKLKKMLTVCLPITPYSESTEPYEQYTETEDEIIIPRFFGIDRYGLPKKIVENSPTKVNIPFLAKLRDYQVDITTKCINHMKETKGCQLVVPCGRGKTVMAIYIAHKLGLKTLILVHKTFLQKQWFKNIKLFTGEDAGLIRQSTVETENRMFCVAIVQSIASRKYEDIFNQFGLVICDESHHYASKCFSKVISKFTGTAYTLGLSGTFYRNDGLVRVIRWYLGEIAYKESIKPNDQVYVKVLTYSSSNTDLFSEKYIRTSGKTKQINMVKMVNNLVKIDERNNLLIKIINELRKDPERVIMVLSNRRDTHVNILKDAVDKSIEEDIKNDLLEENECLTAFYTGTTKEKDRENAEANANIIFATYQMAQEGLDIPRLNTLILATPQKDVNQAVGRILRKILENGDIRPLVIDIADHLSLFKGQFVKREQFYTQNKYIMNYYYLLDDKFISPRDFKALEGIHSEHYSDKIPASLSKVLYVPPVDLISVESNNTNSDNSNDSKSKSKTSKKGTIFDMFNIEE